LVQCFLEQERDSRTISVHQELCQGIAAALHIRDPGSVRLANFAQQEGSLHQPTQSTVLVTCFLEKMISNGVLDTLRCHASGQSRTPLHLGCAGGAAQVVSIDLGGTVGEDPAQGADPSLESPGGGRGSRISPSSQAAQSLGQGFLFGILQEEKTPLGRKIAPHTAMSPLAEPVTFTTTRPTTTSRVTAPLARRSPTPPLRPSPRKLVS